MGHTKNGADALDVRRIVEQYRDTVFRVAFTYLRNAADADDAAQDVFVKLIRKTPAFESEDHLRRWLIRVAINECKSLFRKPWQRVDDLEQYAGTLSMPTPEHSDVFVSVMKLPERYRVPLVLHYYLGFATSEIAKLTNTPSATVRTRLARGRTQLKTILEKEERHVAAEAHL